MRKLVELKPNERIDELFNTPLKVIQSKDYFAFSLDAVLLANFVYVPIQRGKLIDLCTGNGAIPFILSTRTKGEITGIEIQQEIYDLAERGNRLNGLDRQINFIRDDIKNATHRFGHHQYDVVTCNPPYFKKEQARDQNINEHVAIARHEIHITLEDVITISSSLVKQNGKVALVHRPERLVEMITLMKKVDLEPKRCQFVHPKQGKPANMVLIEAAYKGKPGLKVLPPIHVYDEKGHYTKEVCPSHERV